MDLRGLDGMFWTGSSGSGGGPVAGCFEDGNETFGFHMRGIS